MNETMNILCGTSLTDIQYITGCIFYVVLIISICVSVCVARYFKYVYMANRFSAIDDEHKREINKLQIRVTKLENELIKVR